jgi:hypothetical protein
MVGNCLKSLFSSRINAFFSALPLSTAATFSGQAKSTNHFRPQYVMQVSKCVCGAVLNLEITAIVQNPLCLSFHQSKKRNRGIVKKA